MCVCVCVLSPRLKKTKNLSDIFWTMVNIFQPMKRPFKKPMKRRKLCFCCY